VIDVVADRELEGDSDGVIEGVVEVLVESEFEIELDGVIEGERD